MRSIHCCFYCCCGFSVARVLFALHSTNFCIMLLLLLFLLILTRIQQPVVTNQAHMLSCRQRKKKLQLTVPGTVQITTLFVQQFYSIILLHQSIDYLKSGHTLVQILLLSPDPSILKCTFSSLGESGARTAAVLRRWCVSPVAYLP